MAGESHPAEEVVLDGTVERITFRNDDTNYTIAQFAQSKGETVTIIGELFGINEGTPLKLRGQFVVDRKWGRQFKIASYQPVTPKTKLGIERFLGSGRIPGIGESYAKRIVEKFGLETLEIIEHSPQRLTEVPGIGSSRASKISVAVVSRRAEQDVMVFLASHGVAGGAAVRIFKKYGKAAINVVQSNPYRLAHEVWGIGFRTADTIASQLGIARDAPERLEAGLLHALETSAEDGHLHLPDDELITRAAELLQIPAESLAARLGALESRGLVVREVLGARGPCSALPDLHRAEVESAQLLAELVGTSARPLALDVGAAIHAFESVTGLQLATQQRTAVEAALRDRCVVITGGPGVGKTTIVKAIVHLARLGHRKVSLAAPTGRAAKRLGEATAAEATTIHRLLEFNPHEGGFLRDAENPLDADLLVVDEASMVDAMLFRAVLGALRPGAQLVLVGDVDQLPSVGAGSVLADVIDSEAATVIPLTEIFRQAAQSRIVLSAHMINRGEVPDLDTPPGATADFYFIARDDPEAARATIVELVAERIPPRFGLDAITDVQVLTPMHRGELGTAAVNRALQERLNPAIGGPELVRGDRTYRRGDKVMQLRNDYDRSVFNGDIGVIDSIDTDSGIIRVDFDPPIRLASLGIGGEDPGPPSRPPFPTPGHRIVVYERTELDQLVHAYAVSVHKSQGSEYPAVVIPLVTQHFMMLQRSLLYTAVTRGKKLVVLVGSKRAISLAVRNVDAKKRYTWLAERVRAAVSA